jgi:CHAD domain-containing protein
VAKAADIPLHPEMTFAEAAALAVGVRGEELFEHREGVLDTSDIERVHAMRVASRRLRAVLEIFAPCFPRAEHRAVLREVKALADALGERRDPDVQLEAIEGLEDAMGAEARPGLEVFADRIRAEQLEGNATLAAALRHADEAGLHGRLRALVAEATA